MSVVPIVRRPSPTVGVRTAIRKIQSAIDRHHGHVSVVNLLRHDKKKRQKTYNSRQPIAAGMR